MESPAGSAQEPGGFADRHGSARPAGDFTSSAGSCAGQRGGDGRSAAAGTGPPAAALSNGYPVTAADVADRIVALHKMRANGSGATVEMSTGEGPSRVRDPPAHRAGAAPPRHPSADCGFTFSAGFSEDMV